jgi:excisionase family DNA binding protein
MDVAVIESQDARSVPHSIMSRIGARKTALTATELAAFLSVSPEQIYKLTKKGTLPSIRIGTSIRYDPRKTAEWLKSRYLVPFGTSRQ